MMYDDPASRFLQMFAPSTFNQLYYNGPVVVPDPVKKVHPAHVPGSTIVNSPVQVTKTEKELKAELAAKIAYAKSYTDTETEEEIIDAEQIKREVARNTCADYVPKYIIKKFIERLGPRDEDGVRYMETTNLIPVLLGELELAYRKFKLRGITKENKLKEFALDHYELCTIFMFHYVINIVLEPVEKRFVIDLNPEGINLVDNPIDDIVDKLHPFFHEKLVDMVIDGITEFDLDRVTFVANPSNTKSIITCKIQFCLDDIYSANGYNFEFDDIVYQINRFGAFMESALTEMSKTRKVKKYAYELNHKPKEEGA